MTPVRLYDSFRREKVPLEPLQPGKVSMYVCGPTPYAPAHIGHAYSAIAFDTIRRSLRFLGYDVRYVRNVTDVEDKIIKRAGESGEDPMALAARFAADYNRDMAGFGVLPPDVEPRVSTHIPEIIALIERLIARGSAYQVDGDVYFEIATFPAYGALSGMALDELRAGERVEVDERKRDPADFALWKAAKPGEPSWDSPWGKGRPGWHIECSAMTHAHLGETFDLHGGGKDLIFPHHENEIAQSRGAFGPTTFARYWVHNGLLLGNGVKLAKSLGTALSCAAVTSAVGSETLRLFFVSHHLRSTIDLTFERSETGGGDPDGSAGGAGGGAPRGIDAERDTEERVVDVRFPGFEAADKKLDYFYTTLRRIDDFVAQGAQGGKPGDAGDGKVLPEAEQLVPAARAALADDFNTPLVVAALHEAAALANRLLDEPKGIDKAVRRRTLARLARDLRAVGDAIGVFAADPATYLAERRARLVQRRGIDLAAVERLLTARTAARTAKDFARSDAIRGELAALGVQLHDTPRGTEWSVLDDAS
ncbi:MAG TPA: cysteine--tRNA ligase [Kofleriaceae bacterium]|nr:cysteine--tRNA ligase [Kofleriaceae bacterium]